MNLFLSNLFSLSSLDSSVSYNLYDLYFHSSLLWLALARLFELVDYIQETTAKITVNMAA